MDTRNRTLIALRRRRAIFLAFDDIPHALRDLLSNQQLADFYNEVKSDTEPPTNAEHIRRIRREWIQS